MSLLDKAKELLHIGEHKEEVKEDEARPAVLSEDYGDEVPPAKDPIDAIGDETVHPLNIDFWVKRTHAELYRNGISNETLAIGSESASVAMLSIKVHEKNLEKAKSILTELLGDERYFSLSKK